MKKRILACLLALVMLVGVLLGTGRADEATVRTNGGRFFHSSNCV